MHYFGRSLLYRYWLLQNIVAVQSATFDSNSQVGIVYHVMDAVEQPPTYFRTNCFTNAFQEIVDAYGVANYQEANPAVYTVTVISFPFLFAVMLVDWGHGLCLLVGAIILIASETKLSSQKLGSFVEMLYGGRYCLLLMSLFSIYCGLIYNEFFSVPFHIFGVRGLMLDMYDFKNDIWLCHSFNGQCFDVTAFQPAINVLREVQAFLEANPTEIVTIFIEDYVNTPNGLTNLFNPSGFEEILVPSVSNASKWRRLANCARHD